MNGPVLSRAKRTLSRSLNRIGYALQRHRDPWADQRRLLAGRPVRTIFDLGANVGDVTAEYRRSFAGARVFAFEPAPDNLEVLRRRFAADAGVEVVPLGVSNRVGEQTLYLSGFSKTHSLLERPKSSRAYHSPRATVKSTVTISLTTLDAFCRERSIDRVDLLKVDVEGSEIAAFDGSRSLLTERPPPVIFSEMMFVPHFEGQPVWHEIASFLAEFGYSLFGLYETHHTASGQLRFGNAIFVSAEMRRTVDGWP